MTFSVGDYIRVPKGTQIGGDYKVNYKKNISKRDVVVRISNIETVNVNNVYDFFTDAQQTSFYNTRWKAQTAQEIAHWMSELEKITGKDPLKVYWSNGDRWALARDVLPATEAEAPKQPVKTGPSKREQLVPKSKWKFTADTDLYFVGFDWNLRKDVKVLQYQAKIGDEFTVMGKFQQSYTEGTGLQVPIEIAGKKFHTPYASFESFVEASVIPTVEIIVLRDKVTGKYFEKSSYAFDYNTRQSTTGFAMTDKLSKAKKYPDLGKVKSSLLAFTGYYDNLPGTENMPDWMGGPKNFDLPNTWEAVRFNKLTKVEVEIIDIQEWHIRTWKLRALTVEYGSSVRKVFSEIEKKGKVETYKGLLVFRTPVTTITHIYNTGTYSYDDQDEISKERITAIDESIKHTGVKKGAYIRAKDNTSVTIAFEDPSYATLAKLAYDGDLRATAINLVTMQETING